MGATPRAVRWNKRAPTRSSACASALLIADWVITITVPVAVVIEWWRGRTDVRERILGGVRVESLHASLALAAGEALAAVKSASPVDAVVMASAALRGDIVYTSDVDDLEKLRRYFGGVRVLAV